MTASYGAGGISPKGTAMFKYAGRIMVGATTALALALTLAPASTPVAQAEPSSTSTAAGDAPPAKGAHKVTHTFKSESQARERGTSYKLQKAAYEKKGHGVWNMAKAKAYASKYHNYHDTTMAYQIAYGMYIQGGWGAVTHESASDRKKILAIGQDKYSTNSASVNRQAGVSKTGAVTMAKKTCYGDRYVKSWGPVGVKIALDNCTMRNLLFAKNLVGVAYGIGSWVALASTGSKEVAAVLVFIGAAAAITALGVQYCVDRSNIGAVITWWPGGKLITVPLHITKVWWCTPQQRS